MDRDEIDDSTESAGRGFDLNATDVWDRVIEDMAVTAEEYEENGWSTLQLHPNAVSVAPNAEPPGIDVVLSDPEFEALDTRFQAGVRFSEYEVFRADGGELELALLVAKDTEREEAVFVPIHYNITALTSLAERTDRQALPIYLRQLDEAGVLLELTEPDLLIATEE